MDPYLEGPGLWPDVHNALIAAVRDSLGPILRPRYYVRLEERTYLEEPDGLAFVGRPDLTVTRRDAPPEVAPSLGSPGARASTVDVPVPDRIRETYLVVKGAEDHEVVTIFEILSPANKRPGKGRRVYKAKRMEILGTRTSLVEIDLVRAGEPMRVLGSEQRSDYRILVSRGDRRPRAELLTFGLRDRIPLFRLPLLREDAEPEVDLGSILHALYDRAAYDLSIDYRAEPIPPLADADRPWNEDLLHRAGLR